MLPKELQEFLDSRRRGVRVVTSDGFDSPMADLHMYIRNKFMVPTEENLR